VSLLVVTADEATARWAARPIDLGGGNRFMPMVLGPAGVPEITDGSLARQDPELAVLSAIAHGRSADTGKAVRIAIAAQQASAELDEDRSRLYFELVQELQNMDPAKYEYQSEFAKRYVAQGRAEGKSEGKAEGRADLIALQLALRFGALGDEAQARLRAASIEELDMIGKRLLTARSLQEALGTR